MSALDAIGVLGAVVGAVAGLFVVISGPDAREQRVGLGLILAAIFALLVQERLQPVVQPVAIVEGGA